MRKNKVSDEKIKGKQEESGFEGKRNKKKQVLAVILLAFTFALCACGDLVTNEPAEQNKNWEVQSGENTQSEIQEDKIDVQELEEQVNSKEKKEEESEEKKGQESEEKQGQESEKQFMGEEVHGKIIEISDNGFVISKIEISVQPEGQTAVSLADGETVPEEGKLTVTYSDGTAFTIRTSKDGITSSDSPGNAKDLEADKTVIINGKRNGNRIEAENIVIYHFDY